MVYGANEAADKSATAWMATIRQSIGSPESGLRVSGSPRQRVGDAVFVHANQTKTFVCVENFAGAGVLQIF